MRLDSTAPLASLDGRPQAIGAGLLAHDEAAELQGRPLERRIEEWVVSNLERTNDRSAANLWDDMIGRSHASHRLNRKEERQAAKDGDWGRFRLADRKGIATLRLTDSILVKEDVLREFADDLLELIRAGYHRMVLNFQAVERLSSQIVVALAEADRRCSGVHGGRLKICGLRPEVASVLALTGIDKQLDVQVDEAAALSSEWPEPDAFRPLPVRVLRALTQRADGWADLHKEPGVLPMSTPADPPSSPSRPPTQVSIQLIVRSGRAEGRAVPVVDRRIVIGRELGCSIRVQVPTVSRRHAAIERVGCQIFLSDLTSTNGTWVNDRAIQGERVEVFEGDRIAIGPLRLVVGIGPGSSANASEVDGQVLDWLKGDEADATPWVDDEGRTADDLPIPSAATDGHTRAVSAEVVQDVLVITPLQPNLAIESQVGPLRSELQSLAERSLPRRVILDLKHVAHLSSQAIGVIVAHALKLDREGGELRLSAVCPRVMAVLHQIRLPMLIEVHPTTDEAVLCQWRNTPNMAG